MIDDNGLRRWTHQAPRNREAVPTGAWDLGTAQRLTPTTHTHIVVKYYHLQVTDGTVSDETFGSRVWRPESGVYRSGNAHHRARRKTVLRTTAASGWMELRPSFSDASCVLPMTCAASTFAHQTQETSKAVRKRFQAWRPHPTGSTKLSPMSRRGFQGTWQLNPGGAGRTLALDIPRHWR
jgi:hypothetical protein